MDANTGHFSTPDLAAEALPDPADALIFETVAPEAAPAPDAPNGYGATSRETDYGVARVHILGARDWGFHHFPERPGSLWKEPAHWQASAVSRCGKGLDQKMNAPADNDPHPMTGREWTLCTGCVDPARARRDHARLDLPALRLDEA